MNTAVINIKTNPSTKIKAQEIARELGFSLSALINGYLRHLVKTKTVHFTTKEEPSDWTIKMLKENKKDFKAGRISPAFDNMDDAIAWLDDPNARLQNGDKA